MTPAPGEDRPVLALQDVRPPRSPALLLIGVVLPVVGVALIVLAFLGWVSVIWAGIAVQVLVVVLAVFGVRRMRAYERNARAELERVEREVERRAAELD